MSEPKKDTIFAPITGTGLAAVTVYRLSGPGVQDCLRRLAGDVPEPGKIRLADIRDPESGGLIDRGLVLFFAGPNSFTGEDVAELHCHGGRAVRERLTETLSAMADLRPAEPGEFTRRAFGNGRMDLMEAEGIHDLVCAETEAQRKLAFSQMRGDLTRHYEDWRNRLVRAMALFEAEIDFSGEEIPAGLIRTVEDSIRALKADMDAALDDDRRGQAIRRGFRIVVLGPPNVGKSSLFNRIARADAAIVSDTPGTTRDALDLHLDLGGYAVVLTDTAGLRDSTDAIEQEGVKRARAHAAGADLRLCLDDARNFPGTVHEDFDPESGDLLVWNKLDLLPDDRPAPDQPPAGSPQMMISALTGENMPELLQALEKTVQDRLSFAGDPVITRARHRAALTEAAEALGRFLSGSEDPSLRAEDLRLAGRALGRVTGRVDVEDLLDVIFRDFCIGK